MKEVFGEDLAALRRRGKERHLHFTQKSSSRTDEGERREKALHPRGKERRVQVAQERFVCARDEGRIGGGRRRYLVCSTLRERSRTGRYASSASKKHQRMESTNYAENVLKKLYVEEAKNGV